MLLKRGLIRLWIAVSALWLICALSLGWMIGSDTFNQVSKANARIDDLRADRFAPTVFISVAEMKPKICIAPNFQSDNQSGRIVDPFKPYDDLIPNARYCDLPDSLKSLTRWGNLSHQEMKELITLSVERSKSKNETFDPDVYLAMGGIQQKA